MPPRTDTIAAVATAQGRGGIGVIRVSGPMSLAIAQGILGKAPTTRHAHYTDFLDGNGQPIDQGILLFYKAPYSYTGEDVVELQGHGGVAVMQLMLQRCLALGAKLAEPGEFTRRAYLNDKLDLAQAEGVADLIDATTTQAARSAIRSLNGEFSSVVENLVSQLINLRMLVEAMLDFPEEDVDQIDLDKRNKQLATIRDSVRVTLETAKQGSLLREGAYVALVGQPNVGKSSLLNRLSGEQVALVSDIPGTTRDVIRKEIQIDGVPLHIMDTAGLRESSDSIEMMGIALTHETLQKADLILLLKDASRADSTEDLEILRQLPKSIPRLLVLNKIDLCLGLLPNPADTESIAVSAKSGQGIDKLRARLLELVGWSNQENGIFMARERHLIALTDAESKLAQAAAVINYPELFAEELRLAQASLNSITGEFTADDLLGEIFSRFCIGK
ncbi:MAG: tRNA uridine-5-carboxymethylaminomethyl(34) synthesis GTPase MnmE [Gallionella sp.]|nr:tRNA uridine-5-carboxymethylaminomethyl(34) synthesis GTPase MnmE [Gallionella sp.]